MAKFLRSLALVLVFAFPSVISLAQSVKKSGGDSAMVIKEVKTKLNGGIKNAGKKIKNLTPKIPEVKVKALLDSVSLKDSLKLSGLKDGISSAIGVNQKVDQLKNNVKNLDPAKTAGQTINQLNTQVKAVGGQVSGLADTLKTLAPVKNALKDVKGHLKKMDPSASIKNVKSAAAQKTAAFKSTVNDRLKSFKKPDVSLALTFEDAERYQSAPPVGFNTTSKFVNVFSARGTLTAFGVPVNIDYTTDRASGMPPLGNYSNLVKFDLDPGQLNSLYKTELLKYTEIRRDLMEGKDLTAYTRSKLTESIKSQEGAAEQALKKQPYAKYLNDPSSMQELLGMDRNAIIEKLKKESISKVKGYQKKALAGVSNISSVKTTAIEQARAKREAISELSSNSELNTYFSDPEQVKEIRLLRPDQIRQKITTALDRRSPPKPVVKYVLPGPVFAGIDFGLVVRNLTLARSEARERLLDSVSQKIFLSSRQSNKVNFTSELRAQDRFAGAKLDSLTVPNSALTLQEPAPDTVSVIANQGIDTAENTLNINKIADAVMSVKDNLQRKGLDVNRLLAMQKYLEDKDFRSGLSEFSDGIKRGSPMNGFQAVASHLSALKIGSYSNKLPGGGMNQELFLTGAHATVKSGSVPLTFGYGSVNDINAQKDAGYVASVYNQPRNVTFLGAELKSAARGNLKLSVISSLSRDVKNNLYEIPVISSNTVAFTLSKGLDIGRLGQLGFDVSKSTTLYANKFQPGQEVILAAKGGLNSDLSNDLFQALSVGVSHHLDLTSIGATDNVYFNYAGMGYQNPANNGFGGAKMKFGGNVKKTFYGNRLSINLRTDLTNMPISYTSNDRWKNYQFSLESRYTVSKGLNTSFKYTNNGTDKRVNGLNTQVYSFEKFQLDGNASYKIGRNFSVSHFGVGTQAITSPVNTSGNADAQSRLLILNYVHTLVLRKNVLSFTMFYNRELTAVKMIGNMLNTDLAYSYTLFRRLSASSGIVYLENTGIVRQAGIRQSLNLISAGRFDIGSFIDLRKNMITPLYSGLYPGCRAELNLKYHINAF